MAKNCLEISGQFRRKHGNGVNPDLMSLKFCQIAGSCYLEITLANQPLKSIKLDTAIILEDVPDDFDNIPNECLLFNPENDVVDNAKAFIQLDAFSTMMCFDHLFTKKYSSKINEDHLHRQ